MVFGVGEVIFIEHQKLKIVTHNQIQINRHQRVNSEVTVIMGPAIQRH